MWLPTPAYFKAVITKSADVPIVYDKSPKMDENPVLAHIYGVRGTKVHVTASSSVKKVRPCPGLRYI